MISIIGTKEREELKPLIDMGKRARLCSGLRQGGRGKEEKTLSDP